MKKPATAFQLLCCLLLVFCARAQSQIYGMTSRGGEGFGTIFSLDGNGNNHQVVATFSPNIKGQNPIGTKLCKLANGKLLGVASTDGLNNAGVIFEYDPISDNYITKIELSSPTGKNCTGYLLKASNGKIYGVTSYGGLNNRGVIFEYDYSLNTYTKKVDMDSANGAPLFGANSLIEAANGKLYGTASQGGANNMGVIFEYDFVTNSYTKKFDFSSVDGAVPLGSLIEASNGKLYGTTRDGGVNNSGVIYEYDYLTNNYSKKFDFNTTDGKNPSGNLLQASNGKLYGMTISGGSTNDGVIFEFDYVTDSVIKKIDLNGVSGWSGTSLMEASNGKLYGLTRFGGSHSEGVLFEYDYSNNIYTKKADFGGANGSGPLGTLVEVSNGKLLGTTENGGLGGFVLNDGVIFEYGYITNTLTKKIDFNFAINGSYPEGSLVRSMNGKLYGQAGGGGAAGLGSIFELDILTNAFTKKVDMDSATAYHPKGTLVEAANNKMYGVAEGGSNSEGVIFEFDHLTNTIIKKHDFQFATGSSASGSLMKASNGKLYGMATLGGLNDDGVIYEYDYLTNTYTKKVDLNSNGTGSRPVGSLVEAPNGKLYGMTGIGDFGGSPGWIIEYDYNSNTYVKKIAFSDSGGRDPEGSLVLASNGKLYGMTPSGGDNLVGVIFEYDFTTNTYIKKFDFNSADGKRPYGTLMQASNGKLYGMTSQGGQYNQGVIFEYDYVTGTYTKKLEFTGVNGSTPTSTSLIEMYAVGLNKPHSPDQISLFPNPAKNVVSLDFKGRNFNSIVLTMYNSIGKKVYSESLGNSCSTHNININGIEKGVYFLEIATDEGKVMNKIIID